MNDGDRQELTAEQQRARDAVRSLGHPQADADFRARLKRDFVSGALAAQAAPDGAEDVADERKLRSRRIVPLVAFVPVALAAMVAFVVFVSNPLPGPEILATSGEGFVTVDGERIAASDMDRLGELVRPGSAIALEGGASLDIRYPGTLVMRVADGSTLELPPRPGRWLKRTMYADLQVGEVSLKTGPMFGGNKLAVATPDGRAVISGTLASVVTNDELTCICLIEGSLRVETAGARDLGYLEDGMRWVLFRDGSEPQTMTIAPPHEAHMQGLDHDHGVDFE